MRPPTRPRNWIRTIIEIQYNEVSLLAAEGRNAEAVKALKGNPRFHREENL